MNERILCLFILIVYSQSAFSLELSPFKDSLFSNPKTLESRYDGAYRSVDYREMRDINGRDLVPERRVNQNYVSLGVRKVQGEATIDSQAGPVHHYLAGRTRNASVITVYLHGQGGNAAQGMSDFTFGGNFNRIKNLMVRNGGLYLSPDFTDFDRAGEIQIAALIQYYVQRSPAAPVVVACGSAGGLLCWRLADNETVAARLAGLILMGSMWNERVFDSHAYRRRVPLFFGHGSRDTVFPIERQESFFADILRRDPDYPARFVRFETGTHGTPIRMTDWRETLNWMLARR